MDCNLKEILTWVIGTMPYLYRKFCGKSHNFHYVLMKLYLIRTHWLVVLTRCTYWRSCWVPSSPHSSSSSVCGLALPTSSTSCACSPCRWWEWGTFAPLLRWMSGSTATQRWVLLRVSWCRFVLCVSLFVCACVHACVCLTHLARDQPLPFRYKIPCEGK